RFGDALPCALVLWRPLPAGRALAYVPRGPIAPPGDAAALRTALAGLATLARERGALFVKADPELTAEEAGGALRAAGFRRAPDVQPVVAAAMTWRCGEREVYQTAATNAEGRSAYAAYALLWRCIIEAKTSGAKRFDFGGIPADLSRKDDPMQGPYHFKKGFGGAPRRFVGAHDAVANELAYRAYRLVEPVYTAALRLRGRAAG